MTTQHTPGPWEIDHTYPEPNQRKIQPKGQEAGIAVAFGDSESEAQANASLIAAAPELLELCEESLRALHEDDFPILKDKLRAAIAKATANP